MADCLYKALADLVDRADNMIEAFKDGVDSEVVGALDTDLAERFAAAIAERANRATALEASKQNASDVVHEYIRTAALNG